MVLVLYFENALYSAASWSAVPRETLCIGGYRASSAERACRDAEAREGSPRAETQLGVSSRGRRVPLVSGCHPSLRCIAESQCQGFSKYSELFQRFVNDTLHYCRKLFGRNSCAVRWKMLALNWLDASSRSNLQQKRNFPVISCQFWHPEWSVFTHLVQNKIW